MKPRIVLAVFLIPLGLIIAAIPENTTRPYKLTAEELLVEAKEGGQFISTDEVADVIIRNDPSVMLIDVRDQSEYEKYHLPGAVNIPLIEILNDEYVDYLNQDIKTNIFYSNGNTIANQAWMITRQLGYKNNYVLAGGLNYWTETILNPSEPPSVSADDEFARYDFRKAASSALGGGGAVELQVTDDAKPLKPIVTQPKKKRVQGGC